MTISKHDQIKKLIEKSKENITVAEYLLEEGYYNISITRSYYVMFYLASAALLTIDKSYSKHSGLISAFGKEFAATKIINPDTHRILIEVSKQRKASDYDYMNEYTSDEADEILANAKKFSEDLIRYLDEWMKNNP